MNKRFVLGLLVISIMLLCSFSASAFVWVGWIKNSTGAYVNGANVSVNSYNPASMDTIAATYSALTNATGYFAVTVTESAGFMYEPVIKIYSGNLALEVGPTLSMFPVQMFQMGLNSTTLYTQDAVSINITMYTGDSANNLTLFNGEVTDADKGYYIQSFTNSNGTMVYLPSNRNYTFSFWGNGPPVSYTLNNISSYSSPKRIDFKQNTSVTFYSLTGYAIVTENTTADVNFTGFYYSDFVGNMVFLEDNPHPSYEGDNVDPRTGYYNLSLPGPTPMLLMVYANDSSKHYMGLLNVSLTADRELNVTLHTLAGKYVRNNNVINTSRTTIVVTDASTGAATSGGGFIEVSTTYSTTYNDLTIKWEKDISADANSINISLFNSSTAKITVFNSNYAPRKYRASTTALNAANATITVGLFTMNLTDDTGSKLDLNMVFYKSNTTCDVASPPAGCLLNNFTSDDDFNPMQALLGGAVSMRFVQGNGVVIHYVNVDMLKSGPPDMMMTPNGANTTSGSALESAWKFGSKGPDTYNYLLIGVPYNPSTMDESADINISIPVLYDEDWNVLWNTSTMGTGVNLTDYTDYINNWFTGAGVKCTAEANLTQGQNCSLNTTDNMIWLRLPHFSAVGPKMKGNAVTAAAASSGTTTSSSGGGGGGSVSGATGAVQPSIGETPTSTGPAYAGDVIKFTFAEQKYSFDVVNVRENSVDIKFSSGETMTIGLGGSREADVDKDGKKDIVVSLASIKGLKAYMTISAIKKPVVAEQAPPEAEEKPAEPVAQALPEKEAAQPEEEAWGIKEKLLSSKTIGTAIIIVAALLLGLMLWHRRKKKAEE